MIETQTVLNLSGIIDFGHYTHTTRLQGVFGIVDDVPEHPEGGITNIALLPSKEGLIYLLKAIGFDTVVQIPPPADAYEQFPPEKRIMVAGAV